MALPADDAGRILYIAQHVSSDLAYIWDEMGVSLAHQVELGVRYRTVARFAALADSRAEARTALRTDVTLDAATPDGRAALAGLVSAWQSCLDMSEQERKAKAESSVLGLPRPVPANDRLAMRTALEVTTGILDEREEPSVTYLAMKLEEVEAGELRASLLDEVTSSVDEVNANFQSSVDSTGRIRITKERRKAKLPASSEELRLRLRVEAHVMLMLAARFRSKIWFSKLDLKDYMLHTDYVLGDKVYTMQLHRPDGTLGQVSPSWHLLLSFEHRLRKEAYKRSVRENKPIHTTLEEVRKDASIRELHYVAPLALEVATRPHAAGERPNKWSRQHDDPWGHKGGGGDGKGKQKGKGKDAGKGKGKSKMGAQQEWFRLFSRPGRP